MDAFFDSEAQGWRKELKEVLEGTDYRLEETCHSPKRKVLQRNDEREIKEATSAVDIVQVLKHESLAREERLVDLSREVRVGGQQVKKLGNEVVKLYDQVRELSAMSRDMDSARANQYEALAQVQANMNRTERWKEQLEAHLKSMQNAIDDQTQMCLHLQAERGLRLTPETIEKSVNHVLTPLSKDIFARMHDLDSATNHVQVQLESLRRVVSELMKDGSEGSPEKTTEQVRSWVLERLELLEAKTSEKLQFLEKDLTWKMINETRVVEARINDCQKQLLEFMANYGSNRSHNIKMISPSTPTVSISNTARPGTAPSSTGTILAAPPPPPPPPQPSQMTADHVLLLKKLENRIAEVEKREQEASHNLTEYEKNLDEMIEKRLADKLDEIEQALSQKFKAETESLRQSVEEKKVRIEALELELRETKQTVETTKETFYQQLDEKLQINASKSKQDIAYLTAESSAIRKEVDKVETKLDLVTQETEILSKELSQGIKPAMERVLEDLKSISDANGALKSQWVSISKRVTHVDDKTNQMETSLRNVLGDISERVGNVERSIASSQVLQKKAETEFEMAKSRAEAKSASRTNSIGTAPEAVTMPGNEIVRRHTIGEASSSSSTTSTKKNKNLTPEQLEREQKRQQELAAVRKRLEQFEKKWKENQIQRGLGATATTNTTTSIKPDKSRFQPPPPTTPPPRHLATPIASEPAAGPPPRPHTAGATVPMNQACSDEKKEGEPNEDENDDEEAKSSEEEEESEEDSESQIEEDEEDEIWNTAVKRPVPSAGGTIKTKAKPVSGTITCQFCSRVLPGKNTAALHEKVCDKKPVECKQCGISMSSRDIRAHERKCEGGKKETILEKCEYCDEEIVKEELESHKSTCDWLPSRCSHCNMVIIYRDVEKHEARCSKNPQTKQRTNALSQLSKPNKLDQHFEDWDSDQVLKWIKSLDGINQSCVQAFQDLAVDGCMLAELTTEDLVNEFKISSALDRKQIMQSLEKLRSVHNNAKNDAQDIMKGLLG